MMPMGLGLKGLLAISATIARRAGWGRIIEERLYCRAKPWGAVQQEILSLSCVRQTNWLSVLDKDWAK
jgi:hypothetical protein